MKHLKIEEIIDFVSAQRYDAKTAELASRVNTHIISCRECLEKINAYQMLYDELSDMCVSKAYALKDFKRAAFPEKKEINPKKLKKSPKKDIDAE